MANIASGRPQTRQQRSVNILIPTSVIQALWASKKNNPSCISMVVTAKSQAMAIVPIIKMESKTIEGKKYFFPRSKDNWVKPIEKMTTETPSAIMTARKYSP